MHAICMVCHATTGPPGPPMAAAAGPPGPFAALQMVPSDQRWHHGWSPFAIVPMIQHYLPLKNVL